jgi:hypothetical protein
VDIQAVGLNLAKAELSSHQAEISATLKEQCPGFAAMRKLVLGFCTILRVGDMSTLHRWMEQARKTGIHAHVRFVRTLKQDLHAAEAAREPTTETHAPHPCICRFHKA